MCLCVRAWESEQEHIWEPTLIENRACLKPGVRDVVLLSLPSDKAGTQRPTLPDSYQCGMLIIHTRTSDPVASFLPLSYTAMLFVFGLISRDDTLV